MSDSRHQAIRTVLVAQAARRPAGEFVRLEDERLRHFKKVLRLDWGAPLRIVDGAGGIHEGRLEQRGTGGIVLGELLKCESKPLAVELGICLPKAAMMEWIVEKAVECGATSIVPIVSSRSVVRPDPGEIGKYAIRWQKTADDALEQCERAWRAEVHPPVFWKELSTKWAGKQGESEANFVFVSETRANGQKLFTESWKKIEASAKKSVRVCIGPEGGFSKQERDDLTALRFEELSLGETVLRVETAVICALAYVRLSRPACNA